MSKVHLEDKNRKSIHSAGLHWTEISTTPSNVLVVYFLTQLNALSNDHGPSHTSTILTHWVPLPEPGPPNTNTTCAFFMSIKTTVAALYTTLGTFADKLLNKLKIINRKQQPINSRQNRLNYLFMNVSGKSAEANTTSNC